MIKHSRELAAAAGTERLLNAFIREMEIRDPAIEPGHTALQLLPAQVANEIRSQGTPMRIKLKKTGIAIVGAITYLSVFGHYRYGTAFWQTTVRNSNAGCIKLDGHMELAKLLLIELVAVYSDGAAGWDRARTMLQQVENSIEKTERYVRHSFNNPRSLWHVTGKERVFMAEQSLIFGHPFHPTPKSSDGFKPEELHRYAPELGAAFPLHYFAAAPELIDDRFLESSPAADEQLFTPKVVEAAGRLLSEAHRQYRLLPCHPWQAEHVRRWPEVQQLLSTGKLVDLGKLGAAVYPTSSVRTVWDFNHAFLFKLPLNVRITNFIRVNPPEQLVRTIDASRALARVRDDIPCSDFKVLLEGGYRTLNLPGRKLAESFGVIFRENPLYSQTGIQHAPTVVAALLEQPPCADVPPVWEAVRLASQARGTTPDQDFLGVWLTRYLEISLVPLLWLFLERGISMEAHVQNSMVALRDGWPVHFYVRDLEGVSIGRERAGKFAMFGLRDDSPALYPDHEAWHRLKYYFFVNHLGHLIHTLAYYGKTEELALWNTVRRVLQSTGLFEGEGRMLYLTDLLENKALPAKANLLSCFQKRGETPLYVNIPNPLTLCEVRI
ncbi:IucA/IucC family protein [Paenibacillus alkalitolerans]|uniref:IucA/IucC family protein n=1 Tax=Paenibacillus alkalitolerans TaxID=2799335 RepID=UPI0018F4434A|nr:IucA/IucC family protein [Paenibacillus alkalitolerans]